MTGFQLGMLMYARKICIATLSRWLYFTTLKQDSVLLLPAEVFKAHQ